MKTKSQRDSANFQKIKEDLTGRGRKGEGSLFQSDGYWIYSYGYTVDGQQRKKKKCLGSVKNFDSEDAVWQAAHQARNQFITEITVGKVVTSSVENVTCGELLEQYIAYLKAKKKPSAYVIEKCVEKNVRRFFGEKRVAELNSKHFEQYRKMRVEEDGVSNTTVDHDFTYLKSALLLEYKKTPSRIVKVPHIPKSGEDNVRQGFLEFDHYEKVLAELPLSLKCIFVLAYHISNRKGALTGLRWNQVDFDNKVIRFVRSQNRKPVPAAAPIYGDMDHWLKLQKAFRDEHFPDCEHVCFWYPADCEIDPETKSGHGGRRNEPGTPLKSFYESWHNAVTRAGRPDLLFHDLRRSAVRNMIEKVGLSEKRAMEISGHKTRSMILRYNIVSLADIQESGQKLDGWMKDLRLKKDKEDRSARRTTRRKRIA
jgi:integrase